MPMQRRESFLLGTTGSALSADMPVGPLQKVRNTPAGLNYFNPTSRPTFVIAPVEGRLREVVFNREATLNIGSGILLTKDGPAVSFNGSSGYAMFPTETRFNMIWELSLMWVGTVADFANYRMLIARAAANGGSYNPFELRIDSGTGSVCLTRAAWQHYHSWISNISIPSNKLAVVIVTQNGDPDSPSGTTTITINGVESGFAQNTSGALGGYGTVGSNSEPLYIGRRADGYYHKGTTNLVAGWSRVLSIEERTSLSVNPWQIFQPIKQNVWVPA